MLKRTKQHLARLFARVLRRRPLPPPPTLRPLVVRRWAAHYPGKTARGWFIRCYAADGVYIGMYPREGCLIDLQHALAAIEQHVAYVAQARQDHDDLAPLTM